jgi:hypothetical protein
MEFDKEHKCPDIICDECHITFRDICSVKLDQCVHAGKRPYCCDLCNKTFSDTSNLREMPLFRIRLFLIGSNFISVNILSERERVRACEHVHSRVSVGGGGGGETGFVI